MWSLLDNTTALLVVGVVTLILASVGLRSGEAQVHSTQRASGRTIVGQTADWLERDLTNIGYDVSGADPAIFAHDWTPTAGSFSFVTLSDTTAAARADTVRYAYTVVGGAATLDRFVTESGIETRTASAGPSLAGLDITLLTPGGQPISGDLRATGRIDVTLRMRPLLDPKDNPLVWDQQIYPPNLVRRLN